MAEKQTGGLMLLGVLLATIVLLPAAFGGGSVLGYTDNYTDNVSGPSLGQPPDLQPVPPPEPEPVPPDLHPTPAPEPEPVPPDNTGGCCQGTGVGGVGGGGGCCGAAVSPMSYNMPPSAPPPESPPPLSPLAIDVARVPIEAVNLIPFDIGHVGGGGDGR